MKKYYMYLILATVLFLSCQSSEEEPCGLTVTEIDTSQHLKILFIGNSHSWTMPQKIESMAASVGDLVTSKLEAPGGFSFKQHTQRQETFDAIKSDKWDAVVLQGQGGIQALPTFMADTAIYRYVQILANSIKHNSSNTKIILYMTQAYKDGVLTWNDQQWCQEDPLVCNYEGMQKRVKDNYLQMSDLLQAEIAPAGMVWQIFKDKHPGIELFYGDGLHANPKGSYITACTIYSYLFKKKSIGVYIPDNITTDEGHTIQTLVANCLFDCNPDWKSY